MEVEIEKNHLLWGYHINNMRKYDFDLNSILSFEEILYANLEFLYGVPHSKGIYCKLIS